MIGEFHWPIRVYYEDTDAGGIVYHANYLRFLEQARTEWLRSLGFEQDALKLEQGTVFAVKAIKIEYLKPAVFNDLLMVSVQADSVKKVSITFKQRVIRNSDDRSGVLANADITIACVSSEGMRLTPIPNDIVEKISNAT